ncbi:unnamed protein product [Trichogramma brassicae]|uniref:Uncharacterized protein n=1 Tax=Trichogramma brassicae TaxID=86971 RepID=A0A6H5I7R4_9HYME|nr:unnamed protein product [Trichogramma brassicae]
MPLVYRRHRSRRGERSVIRFEPRNIISRTRDKKRKKIFHTYQRPESVYLPAAAKSEKSDFRATVYEKIVYRPMPRKNKAPEHVSFLTVKKSFSQCKKLKAPKVKFIVSVRNRSSRTIISPVQCSRASRHALVGLSLSSATGSPAFLSKAHVLQKVRIIVQRTFARASDGSYLILHEQLACLNGMETSLQAAYHTSTEYIIYQLACIASKVDMIQCSLIQVYMECLRTFRQTPPSVSHLSNQQSGIRFSNLRASVIAGRDRSVFHMPDALVQQFFSRSYRAAAASTDLDSSRYIPIPATLYIMHRGTATANLSWELMQVRCVCTEKRQLLISC